MTVLEILFWLSVSVILYTYLGYGSLVVILSRFKKRFPRTEAAGPDPEPTVTLVVAAFDEGPCLRRKIANALELDYPEEKIGILLIVDGEMDEASRQAACRSGRVAVLQRSERLGKMAAINRAMPGVNTELVVFSDANSMLNREAVRELVRYFADPAVGCVSGEKCVFPRKGKDAGGAGEGIYWRYESRIKSAEAGWGSCIGAVGELYAIRAALFRELPDDTILDDFSISMDIVRRGYRIAYAPGARAVEPASLTLREEFERKARISAGGLQSLRRMPGLLNPFRHGVVSFQYLSHKVLRSFLAPPALFASLPLNLLLLSNGRTIYLVLFLIQLLFYALVAGGLLSKDKATSSGFLFVPLYVALMNAAALAGACRYVRGRQPAKWKKARREADVPAPRDGDRQWKADTAARAYIVCLLLSLAGDVAVLPLPVLNVASVPLSFFIVLAGAVFPLMRPREFRGFVSRRKVLIILAALFLLSGALSVLLSPFPALFGLRWLARYALFLGASFILLFLFSLERRRIDFFLKALLGLALFLALVALIEVASEGFSRFLADAFREGNREIFSGQIRAAATLDHPNTLGCFMALAVLLAVVVRRRSGMGLGLFVPAVVLASAALVLSGSRNALVVLLVSLAALLFTRRTIGTALGALGLTFLSLIVLAPSGSRFAYLWKSAHAARLNAAPAATDPRTYDALRARMMLWQSSLAIFRDHPLLGVGPGGVSRAMNSYASAELLAMDGGKIERQYLNAHNGAINILAEFGGVGALLVLLIFLYPARRIVRRYGLFPPEPEHALILSILLSFVVDAFFYNMLYMTAATTLFFLLGSPEGEGVRFRPAPSTQPDPQQQGQ